MPIYEYHCSQCDHKFDLIRALSKRDDPAPCPDCGEPGDRQLITTFGFKYEGHYYMGHRSEQRRTDNRHE
jgi:putative FmdB family regulatory protein